MTGYIRQETEICGNCVHFRQHYIRRGYRYAPISYGHCTEPRIKCRRTEETCPGWKPRAES